MPYLEFGEVVKKRAALGGRNHIFPGLSRSEKPAARYVCIYGLTLPQKSQRRLDAEAGTVAFTSRYASHLHIFLGLRWF